MNRKRRLICWGALAIFVALLGATHVMASGGAPPLRQPGAPTQLGYQGFLLDPTTGEPVPDGDYTLTFAIYDDATSTAPSHRLWEETQTVSSQDGLPIILDTFESELISLINDYRTSQGRMTLSESSILMQVAEAHSQDMSDRDFFSHINPDGLGPGERLTNAGYNWGGGGELIGAGYSTPQATLDAWKGSPSHDSMMLSLCPTEIGVGYVSGGMWGPYWTAVFAEPLSGGYTTCLYLPIVLKAY